MKYKKHILLGLFFAGTLITAFIVGALCHREGFFSFHAPSIIKQYIDTINHSPGDYTKLNLTANLTNDFNINIPVTYLPQYHITTNINNSKKLVRSEGKADVSVRSHEVALILIDTWESKGSKNRSEPSPHINNIKAFLQRCRKHQVTIIHAPNHPVVDKYPQYHVLRDIVQNFMADYSKKATKIPPFLKWPPRNNPTYRRFNQIRIDGKSAVYQIHPANRRDISKFLKPLENEFVLASYNEFRYVLWKKKIKVLLYAGGALNGCMLQRDTGINLLAGIDSRREPLAIVVLEDCSSAMGSPGFDSRTAKKIMLEYYMNNIAFVANSKDLKFEKL